MRPESIDADTLVDQSVGPLTVLFGFENGKYPYGNSLIVNGDRERAIIDPNLGVVARKGRLPEVDRVIHSHTHEDHIAGTHLFADVPWHAHEFDALGLESIEGLMDIYGLPAGEVYDAFKQEIETNFYYPSAGGDLHSFADGATFEFGGVSLQVIHTPGHTRGHCCFLIEWGEKTVDERLVYLGDIELTGFGPYYGDAWSDLEDFEASIEKLRHVDARWWLTFHHKGLINGRAQFFEMLEKFASMIDAREHRLLEFIAEPRSLQEIIDHRFVYRPGQTGFMVDEVERRSMTMHLDRLIRDGQVVNEGDRFRVAAE